METISFIPFIIVCVAILLDVVSGCIKAAAHGEMSSSTMRTGMWHKASEILLEILAILCSIGVQYWDALPDELGVVYTGISLYIIVMEIVSIVENISATNPELNLIKILEMFGVESDEDEDDEDVVIPYGPDLTQSEEEDDA